MTLLRIYSLTRYYGYRINFSAYSVSSLSFIIMRYLLAELLFVFKADLPRSSLYSTRYFTTNTTHKK